MNQLVSAKTIRYFTDGSVVWKSTPEEGIVARLVKDREWKDSMFHNLTELLNCGVREITADDGGEP